MFFSFFGPGEGGTLSTVLGCFKAKVNGYLNCHESILYSVMLDHLSTPMTSFCFIRRCAVIQHIAEHVVLFLFFSFLQ